jgi:SAM-dependent methyltransferase
MMQPEHYCLIRYLEAKRSVDDRALSRRGWQRLLDELDGFSSGRAVRILEVGAGIGTMVQRMVEWGLCGNLDYTAVDIAPTLLTRAQERLSTWASTMGWRVELRQPDRLIITKPEQKITLTLMAKDIFEVVVRESESWDLLIGHSFLDLINVEIDLPLLFSFLAPGGLFYFTLVFDGVTILLPALDPTFDAKVEACYHRNMDERAKMCGPGRHSQTGRLLLEALSQHGASILAANSSDWVVYPPYPGDEAYFLHHILHFMETALEDCPDLEKHRLKYWLDTRHSQVEKERLIYIAHQLDVLGRP